MKHPSSREFYAYWDDKRGSARAPERSEIEPGAVRELLGDIFVLSYDAAAGYPFRVAGTRVCALLGCDLKDRSFSALFAPEGRREIEDIIAVVSEEMLAAVAGITATSQDGPPAHAADPDRIARPVRERPRRAPGFPGDIVALSRPPTGEADSPRVAKTGRRARLHGL